MKKRMERGWARRLVLPALAALALAATAAPQKADAAVGIETGRQDCSITFTLDGEFPELDELPVTVRVYRVADVDEGGNYTCLPGYESLELGGPGKDTTAEQWAQQALRAMELVSAAQAEPTAQGLIGRMEGEAHAAGTIGNLPTGMYLVAAGQVLSDTYIYDFIPYLAALPNNYYSEANPDDTWVYDVKSALKPQQTDRLGNLVIDKSLRTYNATLGPATFVFQVTAEKAGKVVYNDVVSVNFDGTGSRSIRIDGIPAGAQVTVTEVYSGAGYRVVGSAEQDVVIIADDDMHVPFENESDDSDKGGYGVVNRFTHREDGQNGGWDWEQQADSTGE